MRWWLRRARPRGRSPTQGVVYHAWNKHGVPSLLGTTHKHVYIRRYIKSQGCFSLVVPHRGHRMRPKVGMGEKGKWRGKTDPGGRGCPCFITGLEKEVPHYFYRGFFSPPSPLFLFSLFFLVSSKRLTPRGCRPADVMQHINIHNDPRVSRGNTYNSHHACTHNRPLRIDSVIVQTTPFWSFHKPARLGRSSS